MRHPFRALFALCCVLAAGRPPVFFYAWNGKDLRLVYSEPRRWAQ